MRGDDSKRERRPGTPASDSGAPGAADAFGEDGAGVCRARVAAVVAETRAMVNLRRHELAALRVALAEQRNLDAALLRDNPALTAQFGAFSATLDQVAAEAFRVAVANCDNLDQLLALIDAPASTPVVQPPCRSDSGPAFVRDRSALSSGSAMRRRLAGQRRRWR